MKIEHTDNTSSSTDVDHQFREFLIFARQRVEKNLLNLLDPLLNHPPARLHQAMHYAVMNPGKRVRPMLVYAAGQTLGVNAKQLNSQACAVELIHAYSLIHDDLPAMDDDELRRGQPTCHVKFDEATAILAGDALQALAFNCLSCQDNDSIPATTRLQMIEQLSLASGSRGMCGGQAIDLDAVGKQLGLLELENMHIHKTGALIRAAVNLGAMSAIDADPADLKKLDHYAMCIGLAFQIHDDILDVEGDASTLGKTQGKDAANDKPTYPGLLGLEGAREKAENLRQDALEQLSGFDHAADPLRGLANYIVSRKH